MHLNRPIADHEQVGSPISRRRDGRHATDQKCDGHGYGLRGDTLLHVSDVPRGVRCNCVCVKCGKPLVAKKGRRRKHHFAHQSKTNCEGSAETALHILAKEIFGELTDFEVPRYDFSVASKRVEAASSSSIKVAAGGTVPIDRAEIEVRFDGIVADIVVYSTGKPLIVEISVTHPVDPRKLRAIRRLNTPAIQIQMSPWDALLTRAELSSALRSGLENKQWLYHPGQRAHEVRLARELRDTFRRIRANKWAAYEVVTTIGREPAPARNRPVPAGDSLTQMLDVWTFHFRKAHSRDPNEAEVDAWMGRHGWSTKKQNQPFTKR